MAEASMSGQGWDTYASRSQSERSSGPGTGSSTPAHLTRALYIPHHDESTSHVSVSDVSTQYTQSIQQRGMGSASYVVALGRMPKPQVNDPAARVEYNVELRVATGNDGQALSLTSVAPASSTESPVEANIVMGSAQDKAAMITLKREKETAVQASEDVTPKGEENAAVEAPADIDLKRAKETAVEAPEDVTPKGEENAAVEAPADVDLKREEKTPAKVQQDVTVSMSISHPIPSTTFRKNVYVKPIVYEHPYFAFRLPGEGESPLEWQIHPISHGRLRYTLARIPHAQGAEATAPKVPSDKDILAIYHHIGDTFSLPLPFSEGVLLLSSNMKPETEAIVVASVLALLWQLRQLSKTDKGAASVGKSSKKGRFGFIKGLLDRK